MDLIECINTRRSVRAFTDEQVPEQAVQDLLTLATQAASGSNKQPWGFVVIRDKDEITALSTASKQFLLENASRFPGMEKYEKMLSNENLNLFGGASTAIIIYGATESRWHVYDCSLAAANIMLGAKSMGLGTCWIGLASDYCNRSEFKQKYNVPLTYELVAPLSCGYPDEERKGVEKRPPLVFNQ